MEKRIPASMRTRQSLSDLIEGRLSSPDVRGELVKLVCGDDIIYPDCLRLQVEAMDANPSVVLVASRRDLIDARGAIIIASRGLAGLAGRVPGRMAARHTVVAGSNVFGEPACVLIYTPGRYRFPPPWRAR